MIRAAQHYDADNNIVFVSHPVPVRLTTRADFDGYFGDVADFWRRRCRRPAYYVIDYDGLSSNPDMLDVYAEHIQRLVEECSTLALYRHGGGVAQRTTGRMVSARIKRRSLLCVTREEAIVAIRRSYAEERGGEGG